MRWFLRGAIGLAVVAILVVVVAVITVGTTDFTAYRDDIAAAVEDATGRKVTIGGRIEQNILASSPSIGLTDLAVANADWGSRPQMLTAKRAEIEIALLPLIGGVIKVTRFRLIGADLLLETNAEGAANWLFAERVGEDTGTPSEAPDNTVSSAVPVVPLLKHVRIEESVVTFRDGRSGLISRLRIDKVAARAPTFESAIAFNARGAYNGLAVAAEGTLGQLDALFGRVRNYPVAVALTVGRSRLRASGAADLSGPLPEISGSVDAELLDLDQIAAATGRGDGKPEPAKSGASGGTATRNPGGAPVLFPEDELLLGILGLVNGKITIGMKRLVVARNAFDKVRAEVALRDGRVAVRKFSSRLAKGRIAGTLRLDIGSRTPKFAADLQASQISSGAVLRQALGESLIDVPVAVRAQVSGTGRSAHAIASTLKGPVTVTIGKGPVANRLLDVATTDLLKLPSQNPGRLQVVCGEFALQFDGRGVGRGRQLVLDTNRVTFYGQGAVDLGRESMDFRFVPAGKGVSLTRLASILPISIAGSLTRPDISVEPTAIPKRAATELLGLVTRPFRAPKGKTDARRKCGAPEAAETSGPREKPRAKKGKSGAGRLLDDLKKLNPFRE
ncbi:MAG: AsmA family protein [Rhodospirillaceae bacterium]|nr:AsmA family protein [Rhodospirillaceae bacterium]